jgi:membrane-bound metal-dependent hydrolase YbcI (DUF457 family)
MRPQAHTAASLALCDLRRDPPLATAATVIAGHLPDFDRSVAKRLGVKRRDHHRWVSHSFVGWIGPTALALAASRRSRHGGHVRRCVLSLWLHLLLDTYADGIAWLWPRREDKIGLFRKDPSIVDDGWKTPAPLETELGKAEAAMWGAVAARTVISPVHR